MKKLLLLLTGLLFAILPSKAQNGYTVDLNNPIKETKDLVTGDYIIYCQATNKPSGFLYYKNGITDRPFHFNNGINIASGYISNAYYVWTVAEVEENGKKLYTFTNKQDNSKYLLKDNKWNQNMAISADKEIAQLEAVQFTDDYGFKTIALKLPERITPPEGTTNADPYIFCNGDTDPNLSYWGSSTAENAVHFTFYRATSSSSVPEYPFMLSDAPENGIFSENTHWYYLKLNNRYLSFNDVSENYNYEPNKYKEQKYVYSYASNPLTYGCFWAFVKDGEDLKIYNAATGASMVLASDGSDERIHYPTMVTPGTETYTCAWHYKVAQDATKFYLFLQGTNYENNQNKLNCYAGNMSSEKEGNPKSYLTFSTGAGAYSYFTVELIDLPAAITSVRNAQKAITGAVGTLYGDDYAKFTEALDKGSVEGLAEALKIRDLTGTTIQFDPSKYYRIENVTRKRSTGNSGSVGQGGYLEFADEKEVPEFNQTFYAYDKGEERAGAIWKFEAVEGTEGTYKLQSLNSKQYIKSNGSGSSTTATTQENATGFKLAELPALAQFKIVTADNTANRMHVTGTDPDNKGNVIIYNAEEANSASAWYIIPATTIDITISSAKYATVNYPFAVQLPKDGTIAAYTANAIPGNNSELLLKKVADGFIPANTPVVLEGDAKIYTLSIVAGDETSPLENNILEGTTLFEEKDQNTRVYVLGNNETKGVGFYKLSEAEGANRTITANKAYLPASNLPGTAQMTKGFTFSFDDNSGETTGIEDATINLAEEEFYDLQGRRVLNPAKGIYVTKSGKKILFTK